MKSSIVAGGGRRYLEANYWGIEAERRKRIADIRADYRLRLEGAGFWRRRVLNMKMRWKLRRARDPGENLYLSQA